MTEISAWTKFLTAVGATALTVLAVVAFVFIVMYMHAQIKLAGRDD